MIPIFDPRIVEREKSCNSASTDNTCEKKTIENVKKRKSLGRKISKFFTTKSNHSASSKNSIDSSKH